MLRGAEVAELPVKRSKSCVCWSALTKLSELRPGARRAHTARIASCISAAISLRRKLSAFGIAGRHARLVGIVVTPPAGTLHAFTQRAGRAHQVRNLGGDLGTRLGPQRVGSRMRRSISAATSGLMFEAEPALEGELDFEEELMGMHLKVRINESDPRPFWCIDQE